MFIDQKFYAIFVIKEADHCWCQWQVNNVLRDQRSNGHLEAAHQPKEWASSSWWSHQSRDHYQRWELLSQKIYFIDPPACYIRHIWFYGLRILGISKEQTPWCIFDKPESKAQVQSPSPKSNRKGKDEFGLWAVSKILCSAQKKHRWIARGRTQMSPICSRRTLSKKCSMSLCVQTPNSWACPCRLESGLFL